MAYSTYSPSITAEIHRVVEAKQKSFEFEAKTFDVEAIAKRIIKEFDKLHDPELDAGSGAIEVTHCFTADYDANALYKKIFEVIALVEPKCHMKGVSVSGKSGAKESFEVKFSFYDNPVSYRYRHLEF